MRQHSAVSHWVGLVGISFGGGVALEVAADDPELLAVAHVVGFVAPPPRADDGTAALLAAVGADLAAAEGGAPPVEVAVCGGPNDAAVIAAPDALDGYELLNVSGAVPNATPARSLVGIAAFRPGGRASHIDCPVYFYICEDDAVVDVAATRAAAAAVPHARLKTYRGGHFDVFRAPHDRVVAASVAAFLEQALEGR